MGFICHWLKIYVAEPCKKMNCHICLIIYWILLVMRNYWDYINECAESICIYILVALRVILQNIGKCGKRRIAMAKIVKETIHAKGIDIGIYTTNFENEFISLTDIAKYRNEDDPRFVLQNWMRRLKMRLD